MKFNFIDCIEFEIDWKAVAAIAACVLGYAIITVIQKGEYTEIVQRLILTNQKSQLQFLKL